MALTISTSGIAAEAFTLLELGNVSSFGDDSDQARDAARLYPDARDTCLEFADWSFASQVVQMSQVDASELDVADPDLPHAVALPHDCVALRQIFDTDIRWRRDGRLIRVDVSVPVVARCTMRLTDESQMDATFRAAVAHALAARMSARWLTDPRKRQALLVEAERLLRQAARHDARFASPLRWDGREMGGDWASEAVL